MGTTVRLLSNRSHPSHPQVNIGSFNNLYGSVANMDAMYFETTECKDMLLNTRNSAETQCRNLKINIDFLFSLLTIPLGKVISLMTRDQESPLSIENIHQSILDLNVREYLKSQKLKNVLLNPKLSIHYLCSNHIFPLEEETYRLERTPDGQYNCPVALLDSLPQDFTVQLQRRKSAGGFVRGLTKYMVTDDLVVTPLSSMSCFTYLHSLKVTPSDIEEHLVDIGMEEALNLLRASLRSTSILTNGLRFFILRNPKQETSLKKREPERLFKKPKVEK